MTLTAQTLLEEARLTVPELSAEETGHGLANGEIDVLLDVRDTAEWEREHIEGAIHTPRGLLEWLADPSYPKHEPRLAGQASARIVVLCASGGRSLLAARALRDLGYADVRSMAGGMAAWTTVGLPTVRSAAPAPS